MSGRPKVGDPCEAVVAEFVFGPMLCNEPSVNAVQDQAWGTWHAACAEHQPRSQR